MNSQRYKILLLLLTLLSLAETQLPHFTENVLYDKTMKAKKNSLYSFDIASAFKINSKDPRELSVSTNWGTIIKEGKNDILPLPDSYKASTILLIDTQNGLLNVVGFNKLEKKCLISLFYDEETSRHLSFDNLSRRECSRVRISRYGEGTTQRLITYLEDKKGAVKWIARADQNDSNTEWKLIDIDHYSERIGIDEFHEVKMITPEDVGRDIFVIHQKAKGPSQNRLHARFTFCYSDAGFGSTNSTSTINCVESNVSFYDISRDFSEYWALNWVNFESEFIESKSPAIFVHLDHVKPDGMYGAKFVKLNSKNLYIRYWDVTRGGLYDQYGPEYSGTTNYLNRGFKHYYYFKRRTNYLRVCQAKYNSFEEIKSQSDFEYNCYSESGSKNYLANDEFVEKITTTGKLITFVDVRFTGSLENRRQIFHNMLKSPIEEVDLETYYYSASDNYVFEIKKNFSLTDDPKISIKIGEFKESSYYMITGTQEKPEDVEITVSDLDNSLTHNFNLNFVENFETESVSEREFYIGVSENEKGKVITGLDMIKVRADFIETSGNENEFLSLTPFRLIGVADSTKKDETELKQQPAPEPKPSTFEPVCDMNTFVIFKDNSGRIAYYSKKNSKIDNERYMVFRLQPEAISFDQHKCFGNEGTKLIISKESSKNIYTTILFKYTGEYLTRKFYSEIDLMDTSSIFSNDGYDLFRLKFKNGKEGYLNFRGMYPYYRLNGITGGNRSFSGLSGEFTYYVNYVSAGESDKMIKSEILE